MSNQKDFGAKNYKRESLSADLRRYQYYGVDAVLAGGDSDGALRTLGQAAVVLRQWEDSMRQERDAEMRRGHAERLLKQRLVQAEVERELLENQLKDLTHSLATSKNEVERVTSYHKA